MTGDAAGAGARGAAALLARTRALGARVAALTGWRARGLLLAAGALATLSLPPVGAWPVLYPVFWLVSHMADGAGARRRRASFGVGWWFAFGYFVTGWYWIANALLVFSDRLWWMVPFAALGLPAAMALYYGVAGLAARVLRPGLPRALGLATAFVAADWVRGHLLTGFPWNVWGYGWADSAWLSQGAALGGVYALGALVLFSAMLAATADRHGARAGIVALVLAALIPITVAGYGAARLAAAPDPTALQDSDNAPGLRIVQAGIPQREKWPRRFAARNFDRHLRLGREGRPDWVRAVIWPETAAAFYIEESAPARADIAAMLPSGGLLLTGAPRQAGVPPRLRNAMVAIDGSGRVVASYDKHHLVPFGEYVPFKEVLTFGKVTSGAGDYAPGPGPRTLSLPGLPPVSPLICYEVIFPGAAIDPAMPPAWLLNLTNDAWYGETAGPYQHLQHARLRAIEQGLPLVRAANTGISAAFDGHGREIARLPLGGSGVIDLRLPPPLADPPPYRLLGDWVFVVLLILGCFGAVMTHARCGRLAKARPPVETDA